MSTETPPHRCYSCGPLAARWYEGSAPPNCSEFDRSEKFMFDCLPGYGTCATSLDYDSKYILQYTRILLSVIIVYFNFIFSAGLVKSVCKRYP